MNQILLYLVQTAITLYMTAVLLRFCLQWARADFYNPLSQFIVKVTNPLVTPLRRIVPSVGGLDTASLILAVLVALAGFVVIFALFSKGFPNPGSLLIWSAISVLWHLVSLYFFLILAMIVLSWIAGGNYNPGIAFIYQLTEPVMAPFRKLLPPISGLDLSPILVFIVINVVKMAIAQFAVAMKMPMGLVPGL